MSRNPRNLPPDPPEGVDPGPRSFAEQMANVVNEVRCLHTDLGLRPYRVRSVRVHWSGGEVGRGDITEVFTRELLPRPKVEFRTRREMTQAGITERGVAVLSEVNPQYTADEVEDLFHQRPLARGDEAYLEITMDARDGESQRRRFVVAEPPIRRAWDWLVVLRQQEGARTRAGTVSYPGKM